MERCHPCLVLPVVLLSLLQCSLATENQVLVESWKVTSDIRFRFATTQIRSVVLNADSDSDREAQFHIVLPEDAFITNFTMEMEGVVSVGVVKEKEEAKADYEAAKQRGESAGLFRTQPRHTNKFDYSVNVHPLQRVIFTLTYQEVLRRKFSRYDHVVHLLTDRNVGHMTIDVTIHETKELSMLDIPDFSNNLEPTPEEKNLVLVDRPTPTSAVIHYEHTVTSGDNTTQTPPTFTVRYDVKRDLSAGEVLVVDGYFIHFFAPSSLPAIPKDIVFVLDVSGSMSGRKIAQLKEAMTRIVEEMQEQDRFNLLTFHGETQLWREGRLTQADSRGKREALDFVAGMVANGMTNIHEALTKAVEFLLEYRNLRHVPVVFFLTDGLPSAGTRSSQQIASDVKALNAGVASIHGLAFGDNADYDLLKKVSSQNAGVARKIYEASDAAMQVTGFYNEISTVTLDKVKIEYVNDTVDQASLTQTSFHSFFNGSEVMVAGKLTSLHNLIDIVIQGVGAQGEVNLVLEDDEIFTDVILPDEGGGVTDVSSLSSMAEKSWAFLTIKHLLQQKLKSDVDAEREAFDKRILELSLKYNFVTPLTSIVVTQKNQNKTEVPAIDSDKDVGVADSIAYSSSSNSHQVRHAYMMQTSLRDPMHRQMAMLPPTYPGMPPLPTMHYPRGLHGLAGVQQSSDPSSSSGPKYYRGKKGSNGKAKRNRDRKQKPDKKHRKQKRPPPTCTYLGFSNLESMNLTGPSLTTDCHVDGPRKFPPGEFTLYSLDNGDSVRLVTTKGKRNVNGAVSLVLSRGDNSTVLALHGPDQSDMRLQPRPGYVIHRANGLLLVTSPDFLLRMQASEHQKGRKRCIKWFSYSISILHRGPLSKMDDAARSIFPDACKTPLSKKFLRMRRRRPS